MLLIFKKCHALSAGNVNVMLRCVQVEDSVSFIPISVFLLARLLGSTRQLWSPCPDPTARCAEHLSTPLLTPPKPAGHLLLLSSLIQGYCAEMSYALCKIIQLWASLGLESRCVGGQAPAPNPYHFPRHCFLIPLRYNCSCLCLILPSDRKSLQSGTLRSEL